VRTLLKQCGGTFQNQNDEREQKAEKILSASVLFLQLFVKQGMEVSVKNKRDRLFFTQLFVPQASQSS